jgi:hypothetical protein
VSTRFYLPATGTPGATPAFDASWEVTSGGDRAPAVTTRSGTSLGRVSYPETTATNPADVSGRQFVSAPLAAQTISGTFSLVVYCAEGNGAANMSLQAVLRVVSGDGSTVRGTLYAGHSAANNATPGALGEEMPTPGAAATRIMSAVALSSVVVQDGDRLVVEIGARAANSVTTSYATFLQWGDPASGSDYALTSGLTDATGIPWVELSQVLNFAGSGTTGVLAGTTPRPTVALAGGVVDAGELAGSTPAPVGALAGAVTAAGVLSGAAPRPTAALGSDAAPSGAIKVWNGVTWAPGAASIWTGDEWVPAAVA